MVDKPAKWWLKPLNDGWNPINQLNDGWNPSNPWDVYQLVEISQAVSVLDWWSMDSALMGYTPAKENDGTYCHVALVSIVCFLFVFYLFFLVAHFQTNPQHWTYDIPAPAESSPLKAEICAMALGNSRTVEASFLAELQRCHNGEIVDDGCLGGVIHSRTTTTLFGWSLNPTESSRVCWNPWHETCPLQWNSSNVLNPPSSSNFGVSIPSKMVSHGDGDVTGSHITYDLSGCEANGQQWAYPERLLGEPESGRVGAVVHDLDENWGLAPCQETSKKSRISWGFFSDYSVNLSDEIAWKKAWISWGFNECFLWCFVKIIHNHPMVKMAKISWWNGGKNRGQVGLGHRYQGGARGPTDGGFFNGRSTQDLFVPSWDILVPYFINICISEFVSGSNWWRYVNVPYFRPYEFWGYSLKFRPEKLWNRYLQRIGSWNGHWFVDANSIASGKLTQLWFHGIYRFSWDLTWFNHQIHQQWGQQWDSFMGLYPLATCYTLRLKMAQSK